MLKYRNPDPKTYIKKITDDYFSVFDPSIGGVHILNSENIKIVKALIKGEKINFNDHEGLLNEGGFLSPLLKRDKKIKNQYDLWFSLTESCTFGCSHCSIDNNNRFKCYENAETISPHIALAYVETVIKNVKLKGYQSVNIRLSGGEPLLAWDTIVYLWKNKIILEKKYKISLSFAIITNGYLLDNDKIDFIVNNKIPTSISVDGTEDSHNQLRYTFIKNQKVGSFSTIWNNIELLRKNNFIPLVLVTTTRNNIKTIPILASELVERQIPFRLNFVRDDSPIQNGKLAKIYYESYKEVFEVVLSKMSHKRFDHYLKIGNIKLDNIKLNHTTCAASINSHALSCTGEIYNCREENSSSFSLDIEKDSFPILEQELNFYNYRKDKCLQCIWGTVCAGGCPIHAKKYEKVCNGASPWCESYKRIIPMYIDYVALHTLKTIKRKEKINERLN